MDYFGHKNNGTIKEEGEITDDEDNDERESIFLNKEASRYFPFEHNKNSESRGKSGPKRKDYRRRAEADNRRSSRVITDSGLKKHYRDHQDSRQTSTADSYTPSKFWANRRFRASSVRPLSPRYTKSSSGPRRNDSPQTQKYRGSHDSATDCQDELERLEREQRRIREQLKSLEEEEENDGNNDNDGSNDCVLESLDARSEAEDLATPFPGTSNSAAFNYILENEKSDDDDIDLQELRRLALATSERHNRLMAIEPLTSLPGVPRCDIVVIPDVEPELPEPEVVLVDEEEDLSKNKKPEQPQTVTPVSSSFVVSSSSKRKSKKSSNLKKKGQSNINKSEVHDEEHHVVKSKVTLPSRKKSKTKRHKKEEMKKGDAWIRQREELAILVMDDPAKALEKLLKFASEWEGPEKPILTGTIKDFKRQKHIPVLSDKRAVQHFSQLSVDKKRIIQEKMKELNEQEKKSGQLQDNYEEVEMDIDSNAGDEEDSSNFGELHFGVDFNRAMLPMSSSSGSYQQSLQPALATIIPPSLPVHTFHISTPLPFDGALLPSVPPPIPLQPPPPLPPQPPSYEQDSSWKNQHALLEEGIVQILDRNQIAHKTLTTSKLLYPGQVASLYCQREDSCQDLQNLTSFLDLSLTEDKGTVMKGHDNANPSVYQPDGSLDDAIGKWLRMIRQNQEISHESQDVNMSRIIPFGSSLVSSDERDKSSFHQLIPPAGNSSISGELKAIISENECITNSGSEHFPSAYARRSDQVLTYESESYNFPGETLSPSIRRKVHFTWDSTSRNDKHKDQPEMHHNPSATKTDSYRPIHNSMRRILNDRSPSPSKRVFSRKHLRTSSRDASDSPHSPAYPRRPPLTSGSKHIEEDYSPAQRSASRDSLRDDYNGISSYISQHRTRKLQYEHHTHMPTSSPQQDTRHRQSYSSDGPDIYQPEAPPTKKIRRLSPPPYIPTSIKTTNTSLVPQDDLHLESDSEEEDPIALRSKLLAEVIEKRKITAEGSSNNTGPSTVFQSQNSTHSGLFETFCDVDLQDEHKHQDTRLETTSMILRCSHTEDEEEDVQPPPVISRVSRHLTKPPTLMELCRRKLAMSGEQHSLSRPPTNARNLCSYFNVVEMFEEDNEDLTKSDLETLRAYVIKAHTTEMINYSANVEDVEVNDKPVKTLSPGSVCDGVSAPFDRYNFDSAVNVSSSTSKPNLKIAQICSMESSTPTAEHVNNSNLDRQCSQQAQNWELMPPCPVSSTNTTSEDQCRPTLLANNTKATNLILSLELSKLNPSFKSLASSELLCRAVPLEQTTRELTTNSALVVPTFVKSCEDKPTTSPKHNPVSNLDPRLDPIIPFPVQTSLNKTFIGPQVSLGTSTNFRQQHMVDKNTLISQTVLVDQTLDKKEPEPLLTGVNTSTKLSAVDRSTASMLQSQNIWYMVDSDLPSALMPYAEHTGLSSYSSQPYGASGGAWKYSNLHMLPVHPQVLVPMNSSSGSDGEGEDVDRKKLVASVHANPGEDDTYMALNSQVHGNEKAVSQFLTEQEKRLSTQELSIQKDQRAVKLLVKRAVKFLEAQQKEEEKQKLFRAQLMGLSHKMKTSEKFVMLLKAEKEQTEKQVQLVTDTLLHKKNLYERKVKSIMSLGTKLLGPGYVPRILKPHVVRSSQESAFLDKQSLTRTQEKLKLMEKEKQIAEKLKKLKEAQAEKNKNSQHSVKKMSCSVISSESTWKSSDVIRIDKDLKSDVSIITPRRRSLLEINPSTTPNIPLTPRRPTSVSNTEKENIAKTVVEMRPVDKEASTDLNSIFRMPSGTRLANFCKLQREKALKHLSHPSPSLSSASTCSYPSLSGLQASTAVPKLRLQVSERHHKHSQDAYRPFFNTSHAYCSPLLMFRSYRFNSYFRTKENLCLQSSTYSNKINPNSVLCPYDLQGTCNDDSCQQQHPKDYKLSDHELLEDIVSYCPRLAGARDGSSPGEVEHCIVTYVDNLLSKHKGKMTIDDLCLWLLSQVKEASGKRHPYTVSLEQRVWRPHPKEETGLSLDLGQQLSSHKVEALNMERRVADKDAVVNVEDMRYFAADSTELLLLEASILEDQTNIHLWQRLASKKLYDPNKSPKECLEQALSVLARGLEVNKNDHDLWHTYLTLYRRHSDVKDFPEFCQTALEYAPSYALWFLYLDSLKTYSEKDEVSMQALQFQSKIIRDKRTSCALLVSKTRTIHNFLGNKNGTSVVSETGTHINNMTEINGKGSNAIVKDKTLEMLNDIHESFDAAENGRNSIVKMHENSDEILCGVGGEKDTSEETGKSEAKFIDGDWRIMSHQMLEMILYKTSLNLHTGRVNTAVHFLQMVLNLKRAASFTLSAADHLTSADHLVLWLVYIHVLEWRQLPQQLYSMANQNPGRLMAKENITLEWSTKTLLHHGVDSLVKLYDKASKVWETSERDEETAVYYVKLVQSQVSLLVAQNRHSEAVAKCRSVLSGNQFADIWLTMADLFASCQDTVAVKQVFNEALSVNRYNPKLCFYQSVFLYHQGETELAVTNLEDFAISHFNMSSKNPSDPCQLYSQLLKQQESLSLQAAQLKEKVSGNLPNNIFMWLCYSLLMEMTGKASEAVEVFERSLTHACNSDDVILVWQNYVSHLMRFRSPPKGVRDTIIRSIISVPTKFPVPFSPHSSTTWVNYYHINRLVDAWLAVLSPVDTLDFIEMCLGFMPNNVQLLLRALDLCLDVKETRRAYSWCKFVAVQADRPANLAFWKLAIGLAQVEGTPREVEQMMIGCVETMPLSVSSWKDFLLFEVTRENLVTVQKLLAHCHQLELNIESFVATLSAS